jgi:quercetin dioxygenase-like cupin family protein
MLIVMMTPDFTFSDSRGTLTQLVRTGYRQVNVIESNVGSERGGHYHKQNKETFFVVQGSFRLDVSKDGISETYQFHKGDMFSIPPFVSHSFVFLENTILVSMYENGVELTDGKKDIYKDA